MPRYNPRRLKVVHNGWQLLRNGRLLSPTGMEYHPTSLLTIPQVAEIRGQTRRNIRERLRRGSLRGYKIGDHYWCLKVKDALMR